MVSHEDGIQKVIDKYNTSYEIYVETQSNNLPSQKCYQWNGFVFHHIAYIIHLWSRLADEDIL